VPVNHDRQERGGEEIKKKLEQQSFDWPGGKERKGARCGRVKEIVS